MKTIRILGTRGIPAQHGGFETFAEALALYLVDKGWRVTVYCQADDGGAVSEDKWHGIRLVHIPVRVRGAIGTIIFDWKSTWHASTERGVVLTLGYNTAVFGIVYRLRGIVNLINMDGIEWRRQKWTPMQKAWLYLNERCAGWLGNHLIADHPEIKAHHSAHVSPHKITMIPYGAHCVQGADAGLLEPYGLRAGQYAIVIARGEPENSILQIVEAYSRKPRGLPLVILGRYEPNVNTYHRRVLDAAGPEVKFVGPVYDKAVLNALRHYACLYVHGHTVGGTNPSLVEALGASMPVLAHDNMFNRWVAGEGARYFDSADECARQLDSILENERMLAEMKASSYRRFCEEFEWPDVLGQYESLLTQWMPPEEIGQQ